MLTVESDREISKLAMISDIENRNDFQNRNYKNEEYFVINNLLAKIFSKHSV